MRALTKHESIALLAIVSIILHLIFLYAGVEQTNVPLYFALLIGGGMLLLDLGRQLYSLEFRADLLAGLAIVTSLLLGQYLAGTLVVLMLSGGEAIEHYAVRTASRVLQAFAKRAPTVAHRKEGNSLHDITVEEIVIGDILQILPHELCPVDGEVMDGHGVMDEAYLTGEPL